MRDGGQSFLMLASLQQKIFLTVPVSFFAASFAATATTAEASTAGTTAAVASHINRRKVAANTCLTAYSKRFLKKNSAMRHCTYLLTRQKLTESRLDHARTHTHEHTHARARTYTHKQKMSYKHSMRL